jgi:D-serine deaminase-like pyridoxal phosphate-dependent protein
LAKFSGGSVDDLFATKVVAGDPPDADFALPANAVDLPPSQFENSLASVRAGSLSVSRLDAVYYAHKAFREAAAAPAKPGGGMGNLRHPQGEVPRLCRHHARCRLQKPAECPDRRQHLSPASRIDVRICFEPGHDLCQRNDRNRFWGPLCRLA